MRKKFSKNKILIIVIFVVGVFIVGGTYAFLTFAMNITNGNVNGTLECFQIEYSIENSDSETGNKEITGTLFPSINAGGGLNGRVTIGVNSSCNVTGVGTLYLFVNEETSSELLKLAEPHCENSLTLETLSEFTTSDSCNNSGNGVWVSNGTGIKYAVYSDNTFANDPLNVGYITSDDIGNDVVIFNNFEVNATSKSYYIYIWMDGYLTDNTIVNLPFSGYIHASVIQNE